MSLRGIPLLIALALCLASSSQAAVFVAAPPTSAPPSTSENACTAFLPNESESRIGLLVGNDPLDRSDPMGLDFTDEGYGFTAQPSSANFGYTSGTIGARSAPIRIDGGYKAHALDIDLRVRSTVRTTSKQSYDPTWDKKGADLFKRNPNDVQRTVKHEGQHRENNKEWYNQNHDRLLKSVNNDNKTYKTPEAAADAVQRKVEGAYQKFSSPDVSHQSQDWQGWKIPPFEHPQIPQKTGQ